MMKLGAVVIGRNEGARLERCLDSLRTRLPDQTRILYVDSGSTDASCEQARRRGIQVISLDLSIPFTAARARNAGWNALVDQFPEVEAIQFLDGDCQLLEGWMETAQEALEQKPEIAIVCGRRVEQFPDASPYNLLADMEWNTSVGETAACGGDALIRVEALKEVQGYDPALICGEEPEMCIRLRRFGWRIVRLDADMTLHDAAMLRFSQWWKRSVRAGWSVAEGYALYGKEPERYMKREQVSGWLWGALLPGSALSLAWLSSGLSLLLLGGYGYLGWRIYSYRRTFHHDAPKHARLYALFCVLSKFPQLQGQLQFAYKRWRGQQATLIEYKAGALAE